MSTSITVEGVRDLGGTFDKMMTLKLACENAGASYPEELEQYCMQCNVSAGEDVGVIQKQMDRIDIEPAIVKSSEHGTDQWIVELYGLPNEVKAIRFRVSW